MEQFFSKLPYKREKKFPTQKYWLNRPILILTFFCFDILKSADTFITDNWGEREDTQKVLVAICTLDYFSWLYTFIFVQMFFYTLSSLEPLLFIPWKRTLFFKVTLQTREKYSGTEKCTWFAVFRYTMEPVSLWGYRINIKLG